MIVSRLSTFCRNIPSFSRVCLNGYNKHFTFDEEGTISGTKEDSMTLLENLKERYELSLVEYPDNEMFDEFLNSLYDEIEMPIVTNMNLLPMEVGELAKKLDVKLDEVNRIVDDIAGRGLIFDVSMYSESDKRFIMLPEFVVGWYELSVVHEVTHLGTEESGLRDDVDFHGLMKMYDVYGKMYMTDSYVNMDSFCHRVAPYDFTDEDEVHYVDYETAVGIINNADRVGVMGCVCKMHQASLGNPLDEAAVTERCCMLLDENVDLGMNLNIADELTKEEALDLLKRLADSDHMHQPENNQRPRYLCNCHKRWCNVTLSIRDLLHEHITVTSNFIPKFDSEKCIGCGVCVERCPLDIIQLVEQEQEEEQQQEDENDETKTNEKKKKKRKKAQIIDREICLGCLSCKYGCKVNAISAERVPEDETRKIPVDFIEHMVDVAFERNKLNTLLFDDPQKLSHKLLRRVFSFVESNPLAESVKNIEAVNSKFLEVFVKKAREEFEKKLK